MQSQRLSAQWSASPRNVQSTPPPAGACGVAVPPAGGAVLQRAPAGACGVAVQ